MFTVTFAPNQQLPGASNGWTVQVTPGILDGHTTGSARPRRQSSVAIEPLTLGRGSRTTIAESAFDFVGSRRQSLLCERHGRKNQDDPIKLSN